WAYKEGDIKSADKEKFEWLNRLIESNQNLSDPNEFLETVKIDLFSEEVYVFTPAGEVKEFPQGATPLDFAYAVHTDVGNHCIGARVNNRMVPLKYKLKSGDTVEILTSVNQRPHKDWLKIVKSSRAKSKIRNYIKTQEHERSLSMGEMILDNNLKREGLKLKDLIKNGMLDDVAEQFTYRNGEDLLSAIGYGKISPKKVISRIAPKEEAPKGKKDSLSPIEEIFEKARSKSTNKHAIKVRGIEDLLVRFARCCNPVPGDSIVGFITRGRGISVHTRKCPKIFESDPHRLVEIEWDLQETAVRKARIRIICEDRPGLLADMSREIRDLKANISHAQIGTTRDNKAVCLFSISVTDVNHLRRILSSLEAIDGVISATRVQKREV
ncbi:MAG: bifunctional (p)ppGpp synthetase/guanosine-3',5'-bis(diphosphate) 3'-pyrophosphohydrolase, partial [Bdellovibrionales bacterium]|nr:bifunctional (p)ppGpp synthetase/guanosine-3',5'-bis(diphosphate) 3'-pyrophosphohydrolase [Bdellovibrionales bacterium]